jgi:hypothetical protein
MDGLFEALWPLTTYAVPVQRRQGVVGAGPFFWMCLARKHLQRLPVVANRPLEVFRTLTVGILA